MIQEETPDSLDVLENVPTEPGARTMALDVKTGRLFLVTAKFGPPPAPTPEHPHPRGPVLPGTFELLVYGDEGHGLAKLKNRLDAYPKAADFLDEVLTDPG